MKSNELRYHCWSSYFCQNSQRYVCRQPHRGCQMVYFQTKNPNLGIFWRILQWKMLVYFVDIWCILHRFSIFYAHWVYFVVIWYIFFWFGMLYQEISGNPEPHPAAGQSCWHFADFFQTIFGGKHFFCWCLCRKKILKTGLGSHPWLPDGLFSNQKYEFGLIL
jgi:hypothetical protein